jgi:hypothetical protein
MGSVVAIKIRDCEIDLTVAVEIANGEGAPGPPSDP